MRNFKLLKLSVVVALGMFLFMLLSSVPATAQNDQQQIPDAPTPSKTFPKPTISPTQPPAAPGSPDDQAPPTPSITTVPPGSVPREENTNSREELLTFVSNPTYVNVPVTVRDDRGQLVAGLLPKDFEVLENGRPQKIVFFTSDPFPLTAAVVIDLAMPDVELAKVKQTLPALMGAFGQYDEVAVYTYGTTVNRVQGFVPAQNDTFIQTIQTLQKKVYGRTGGVPVTSGPLAGGGPTINGIPVDRGAQQTVNAPQNPGNYQPEAHVLNDAILRAAEDLSLRDRDRTRRKVIFVISNGRELDSDASYNQVLKVLLTQQIAVYGVAVGESALPVYKTLGKIHLPGQGYLDILPKYARATGGQIFTELSQPAIETAYSRLTVTAKNQYTLGYMAQETKSSSYREIEVRVLKPDLRVTARSGYYPLPPLRPAQNTVPPPGEQQ
jgi:VWFA-related protein